MRTELLDAYLNGDLQGESADFIEAALKNDGALREFYFQQVRMDAALKEMFADEESAEETSTRFADGVMARLEAEPGEEAAEDRSFAKSVLMEILEEREARPRPLGWGDWLKAGGIAAAAIVAAIALFQSVRLRNSDEGAVADSAESADHFVGRVTAQEDAQWVESVNGNSEIDENGWLRPGMIEIETGVAEITFNSGARVYLEGPAVFELERPNRGFLESGRLTAEVPEAASGFVINTPRMNVVDLGTRFGVSVAPNGDTEAHVMEGTVEVSRSAGNAVPMIVNEGLAVRADGRTRSRLKVIEYTGDTFALRIAEAQRDALQYIRYNFDETGSEIEESGVGLAGGTFDTSIFPQSEDWAKPRRAPGAVGGGLSFSAGQALETRVPENFLSEESFTAGFWVKIPPRSAKDSGVSVLRMKSNKRDPSMDWRITWNPESGAGIIGALRVNGGGGFVIGTSDLRDGLWHHVAVQFLGGRRPELTTHLHLYVDGKLESLSGSRDGVIPRGEVTGLSIGAGIGDEDPAFEGWIDELHLFSGAVSPLVIQRLADGEKLP